MPYSEMDMQEQGQGRVEPMRKMTESELNDLIQDVIIPVFDVAKQEGDLEGMRSALKHFASHTDLPYNRAVEFFEHKAQVNVEADMAKVAHRYDLAAGYKSQDRAEEMEIKTRQEAEKRLYDIQMKEFAGEFSDLTPGQQKLLQELKTRLSHQIAGGPPTSMRQTADGSGWEQVRQSPDGSWRGPGQQQRSGIFMQAPGEEGGGWHISDSPEGRQIAGAAANKGPLWDERQALYQEQVQLQKELAEMKKQGPHTVNYNEGDAIGSNPNLNPQGYRKHDPAIDWDQALRPGNTEASLGERATRGDFRGEGPMYEEGGPGWEAQQRHGSPGDGQDFQRRAVRGQVDVRATQEAGDKWRAEYAAKRARLQEIAKQREALTEQSRQMATNPEHRQAREALNQQARQQAEADAYRQWKGNADVTMPGQGGTDTADSAGMNPATGAPDNRRAQAVLAKHADGAAIVRKDADAVGDFKEAFFRERPMAEAEQTLRNAGQPVPPRGGAQAKPEGQSVNVGYQQPGAQQANQADSVAMAKDRLNGGLPAPAQSSPGVQVGRGLGQRIGDAVDSLRGHLREASRAPRSGDKLGDRKRSELRELDAEFKGLLNSETRTPEDRERITALRARRSHLDQWDNFGEGPRANPAPKKSRKDDKKD